MGCHGGIRHQKLQQKDLSVFSQRLVGNAAAGLAGAQAGGLALAATTVQQALSHIARVSRVWMCFIKQSPLCIFLELLLWYHNPACLVNRSAQHQNNFRVRCRRCGAPCPACASSAQAASSAVMVSPGGNQRHAGRVSQRYSAAVCPASRRGTVCAGRSSASPMVHRPAPGRGKICGGGGRRCGFVPCVQHVCQTLQRVGIIAGAGHCQHVRAADHLRLKAVPAQIRPPAAPNLQQNFAAVIRKSPGAGHRCRSTALSCSHNFSRRLVKHSQAAAPLAKGPAAPAPPATGCSRPDDQQRVARRARLKHELTLDLGEGPARCKPYSCKKRSGSGWAASVLSAFAPPSPPPGLHRAASASRTARQKGR